MQAPTVTGGERLVARPEIEGTWSEGIAKTLKASLAGTTYTLGVDEALTTSAGVWKLKVPTPLKDGVYDIVVETADAAEKVLAAKDEVVVDAVGPATPTVRFYSAETSPEIVAGTWAEGDAMTLTVSVTGLTTLGTDPALSSDGKGNWMLALSETLKPGSYDVAVTSADKRGRVARDQTRFEILVKEPKAVEPPAPPPPPPPPPPPSPEMKAPTVMGGEETVARPEIKGTWSEGIARTLQVSLAGKTYVLGTDEALRTSAGVWGLNVPTPLKDGVYDVVVETADKAGKVLSAKGDIVIDAVGPAAPTVRLYSGETSPGSIGGNWAEGNAVSLTVSIAGTAATLGTDQTLSSDSKGAWTLVLSDVLKSGSYDVAVKTADKHGRIASDQTRFEILVKEPKAVEPPAPAPPPPKIDCNFEFTKTLIISPIHFDIDKSAITGPAVGTVAKLAAIAGQCLNRRIEIGGHTDNEGSNAYNQALSERRAIAVMRAVIDQGIAAERLTAVGYGEAVPLAANDTPQGRAVNRRIELKTIE